MWELIRQNKRRAAALVAVETFILALTGFVLGAAIAPGGMWIGTAVGLGIALVLFAVAYGAGDQALLAFSGARELAPDSKNRLWNVVEEMKIAAGLPKMPRVYIIDDDVPNAFACGRSPDKAAIAVTSGLLKRLNRDELQGVVAHEIAHIVHRDTLYMTLVSVMVGAVALLAQIYLRSLWYGSVRTRTSRRSEGGGQAVFVILAIVLAILAPIVARLVYLAVSRRREYLADAGAALFTRYPEGLASALEKIALNQAPLRRSSDALKPLYIVPPEKQALHGSSSLWSTHPPTEKRIAVLRAIGTGVSWRTYQETLRRITGGKENLPKSLLAQDKVVQTRRPSEKEDPKRLHRETTDLLWQLQGFRFHRCDCGLTFKVPPGRSGAFTCPRCKKPVTVAGA